MCKHQREEIAYMGILEILLKLVGVVTGLLTIAEKCHSYIAARKRSKKDPSASLAASDGPGEDCISNH